jgi:broad specificity phosphatase PhoE
MALTQLILVRHGESTGNVAREQAMAAGAEVIEVGQRDPDVPLTDLGREQAAALGRWLAELGPAEVPEDVWSSTYVRARQTAAIALTAAGLAVPTSYDERLRDRELGILDLLTSDGIRRRYPDEAQRRRWLGKLYYRPPGGESWADVVLRLRSFLRDLDQPDGPGRVLVVCHDAIILLFRYICEHLDEDGLYALAAEGSIRNASVTVLQREPGDPVWSTTLANSDEHIGAPSTEHPNRPVSVEGARHRGKIRPP